MHTWDGRPASEMADAVDAHIAELVRQARAEADATIRDLRTSLEAEQAHGSRRAEEVQEVTADFMEAVRLLMVAETERDAALRGLKEAEFKSNVLELTLSAANRQHSDIMAQHNAALRDLAAAREALRKMRARRSTDIKEIVACHVALGLNWIEWLLPNTVDVAALAEQPAADGERA